MGAPQGRTDTSASQGVRAAARTAETLHDDAELARLLHDLAGVPADQGRARVARLLADHAGLLAATIAATKSGDVEHGGDEEVEPRTMRALRAAVAFLALTGDSQGSEATSSKSERRKARRASVKTAEADRGHQYVARRVGDATDVERLHLAREEGWNVMLLGPPGSGKTALVQAAFGAEELETFAGHRDAEVADLVGGYTPRPQGEFDWVDGPLVRAMRHGRVLFIDDATLCPSGVLARLFPAIDHRRRITVTEHVGEVVDARPGFVVVVACNPGQGGWSPFDSSDPFTRRFALRLRVSTDLHLARELGVDPRIVRLAAAIQRRCDEGDAAWAPQMRELVAYQTIAAAMGEEVAIDNLVGLAPADDRALVLEIVRQEFPHAKPLQLGERA